MPALYVLTVVLPFSKAGTLIKKILFPKIFLNFSEGGKSMLNISMFIRKKNLILISASILILALLTVFFILDLAPRQTTTTQSLERQVENLHAFAKLYGYVRYFHPSDEASNIHWESFARYGVTKVINAEDTQDLKAKLEDLFVPIAPTIQIYTSEDSPGDPFKEIDKNNTSSKYIAWQHQGLATHLYGGEVFKKERVIFDENSSNNQLFTALPSTGGTINKTINDSLYVSLPLALIYDGNQTLGSTSKSEKEFESLLKNIGNLGN